MGTSTARRPPTTWFWRRAKGAATRYMSPEGQGQLEAREVVARYLAALGEETGGGTRGLLADFRLTRKVGQNLGALVEEAASRGWDAALGAWGLSAPASESGEIPAAVLAGALLEPDGGLETAVARSSLAAVIQDFKEPERVEPGQVVARFLVESLYQRLVLDLGESLEAAADGYGHWRQGLEGIKDWILKAGTIEKEGDPPTSQQWRGLAGWQWVTLVLEKMLGRLLE